jgi:tetratricopeptide (TPR) repeat protein
MSKAWGWLLVVVWVLALIGEVVPLSWWPAFLVVPVSLTLAGLLRYADDGLWRPPGYAALVGWFVLLLIQCVPLPPGILSLLSPGGYSLYSETVWVLRPDAWMPIALTAKFAFLCLMQFMVIAGVFFMTAQTGADHAGLGKLLQWFGLVAGLVALALIGCRFSGLGTALSLNTYNALYRGGVASLAALVPLVLACHLYAKPHQNYGKWSTRLLQALRHPARHLHGYLLVSALVMSAVVISFGSLQIQVSLTIGLLIMTVMLFLRRSSRTGFLAAVLLSLLVLVVVGLGSRKTTHQDVESFSVPVFTSLDRQAMVKDFVLFGAGPGNLSNMEMRYTTLADSAGKKSVRGVGLPVLFEGGLVGVLLFLCFWIALILAGITGWFRRRNRMSLYLFPGVLAGLVVCFASGSDTLQPSILWPGMTGYFLGALLIAIGCFSSSGEPDSVLGDLSLPTRWTMLFFAAVFGLAGAFYAGGKIWLSVSENFQPAASSEATPEDAGAVLVSLQKKLMFDFLEADHWFALGNYWAARREDASALAFYGSGLRLNPLAGESLYRVGAFLEGRGSVEAGNTLLQAGLKNSPLSAALQRDHLLFLLSKGDVQQAMVTLSRLLLLDSKETGFWLRYFESEKISIDRWRDYLPHRAEVYLQFGDYLVAQAAGGDAGEVYMQAVKMAVTEPWVSTEFFRQVAAYFIKNEGFESAFEVLRLGMEARPRDLSLLLTAGSLYQRLGITYRAEELYRKALLLDPENTEVRSLLDNL